MVGAAGSAEADSSWLRESWLTMRVVPSEDTLLDRVLRLLLQQGQLLERFGPEWAVRFFHVCTSWRGELVAVGVCERTMKLCSALAEGGHVHCKHEVLRGLDATTDDDSGLVLYLDVLMFLANRRNWKASLHEWLQAASQEPAPSFLSRGAALTAQVLGLALVWSVREPQRGSPGSYALRENEYVSSFAFSRDGQRAASGLLHGSVKIWAAETGAKVCSIIGHDCTGSCICTKLWYYPYRLLEPDCPVEGHSLEVFSVDLSPNGKQFVTGSADSTAKIWDIDTGAVVHTLRHYDMVRVVAWSLDGNRIASGSSDMEVSIWNAETGALMRTLEGHTDVVRSVAFSRDCKRIVSGSEDRLVKIWNVETGVEILTIGHTRTGNCTCTCKYVSNPECTVAGHSCTVIQVAFSHDGAQVVSAQSLFDHTVYLWDVASGRQVRQLVGGDFALVGGLEHHKKDSHVITTLRDTLMIYEVGTEQQHAEGGVAEAPVAYFNAPQTILSVRCFGATIYVGCFGGAECTLSAPFIAA